MIISIILIIIIVYLFTILISVNNKNYSKKKNIDCNYFKIITSNYIFAMIYLYIFLILFKSSIFNKKNINITLGIGKIILYLILIDILFYFYHRIVHRTPCLKNLHNLHHEYYSIPSDAIYVSKYELLISITLIFIPSLFLNLRFESFILVIGIYYLHQLYVHSESQIDIPLLISSKYHEDHHKIGGGNYCVLFPFLDFLLNTKCV